MIHYDEGKYVSDPGSPIRPVYSAKVESDGEVLLTKVGEENIQEYIDACKDSTDIATIVSYYNQTGDETVLKRYAPTYGDFTKLPKSLAEFLQLRIDSENFFYGLLLKSVRSLTTILISFLLRPVTKTGTRSFSLSLKSMRISP